MSNPLWLPDELPADKPSAARMYDYLLGGYHNFATDRAAAEQMRAAMPLAAFFMQAHRAFLRRVIRFLVRQGFNQFLDLASTIPTVGSAHEVAQALDPAAHVVYLDIDPDSVRHSEVILRGVPNTATLQLDVSQPEQILHHADVRRLLDFSKPLGVLLGWLFFIPDDKAAYGLVHVLREAIAPGSYVAIAHATSDESPREAIEGAEQVYAATTAPARTRTRAEIERFFAGLELVDPGVVWIPQWWPEGPDDVFLDQPERSAIFAGVGRKL